MFHAIASRVAGPLSLAIVAAAAILGAVPSPADAAVSHKTTADGHAITLASAITNSKPPAPLDSNPFTKETFFTVDSKAAVTGLDGKVIKATVVLGYQFGYPVAVAPDGVAITLHTPDLKLQGGIVAKVAPEVKGGADGVGLKAGEAGVESGAEATVLPPVDLSFTVAPGKIHEST